ncbi:MAG: dihydroorotate dehydrogenase [Oscillospiraceae bacterium]|jgi:dihydroorotate dehydrogenase (NAD+) catalytic subunit|nr:dihydroorotate dehydrogenase [Oscillospiraceae bacterium]
MADLRVSFCGIEFKNPILTASGTFGFGREYAKYYDLSELGGVGPKGLTPVPRAGNPTPRAAETQSGMLNAIGLQNPGVDAFIRDELPFLRAFDTRVVANISANTAEEYGEMAAKLSDAGVDIIEVNVSCPNVRAGGMQFGVTAEGISSVTARAKQSSSVPIVVKLSPNVTDIAEMARAAEGAGADGLSLINTLLGMRINVKTRRPALANVTGGLSGPAVFPVAVRMIWQARSAVRLPIIGMGGVCSGEGAAELMLAGASLVAVGTASFIDPMAPIKIRDGLGRYMDENGFATPARLTGAVII